MSDNFDGRMVTAEGLVIWPDVFKAKAFKDPKTGREGNPKFQATMLIKKDSSGAQELIAKIQECATANFNGVPLNELKTKPMLKDGDKEAALKEGKRDYMKGYWVLFADCPESRPPQIRQINGDPVLPGAIQGGEVVRFWINIAPKDDFGTPGIKAYLNGLLVSAGIGEEHPEFGKLIRIGGQSADDAFSAYMGGERKTNPAEGLNLNGLG